MKRLFIRRSEAIKITGWGKTKTGEVFTTIRDVYQYPIHRNDIEVKHFADYLGIDENDVQTALEHLPK